MDQQWIFWLQISIPFLLLMTAYFIGSFIEQRHFKDLRRREERYRRYPVLTLPQVPNGWEVEGSQLVKGNVVVSLDYFKRFLAALRALFGGRIRAYEPLLDRARREALLRMTEDAVQRGYHMVINVRLETSRLANARGNGEGTAGVEMLAFGTALKIRKSMPVES